MGQCQHHGARSSPRQFGRLRSSTNGRRLNNEARGFVINELYELGYKGIPSQANFIMFDVKRPVVPLIQALKQRNVQVGRLFPALPNYMRLTIGKKSEMESFLGAF